MGLDKGVWILCAFRVSSLFYSTARKRQLKVSCNLTVRAYPLGSNGYPVHSPDGFVHGTSSGLGVTTQAFLQASTDIYAVNAFAKPLLAYKHDNCSIGITVRMVSRLDPGGSDHATPIRSANN